MVFTEFYRVFRHFHANRNTHRCFYRVFFLNYHHFFFVYFRFMVWNESFPGGAMVSAAIKEMSHFLLCWLPGFTEFFFPSDHPYRQQHTCLRLSLVLLTDAVIELIEKKTILLFQDDRAGRQIAQLALRHHVHVGPLAQKLGRLANFAQLG